MTRYKLTFSDQEENKHEIEYDEIVSFAPSPLEEKVGVHHKWIWRNFDGLPWKSKELEELNLQPQVFVDMLSAVRAVKKRVGGVKINNIKDSCSIKCCDFAHQGMFDSISGHRNYPFVFNNSCSSWININESFIYNGCSSYIGTLWKIENSMARDYAESFYNLAIGNTILMSYFNSLSKLNSSDDEGIYILWGLPFSTMKQGTSVIDSRFKVASHLLQGLDIRKAKNVRHKGKVALQNIRLMRWGNKEIKTNLALEEYYLKRGNY